MTERALYQGQYRVASARLPGYDYGQNGAYFITICTTERQPYFGSMEVPAGDWGAAFVRPSTMGQRVQAGWNAIPTFAPFVTLDTFLLMSDHVHGVLLFDKAEDPVPSLSYENCFGPQCANLAAVLRGFKAGVSSFARAHQLPFAWQPRFYDRIVRSESELTRIRAYILTNPSRWQHEWDNGEGLYR